MDLKKRQDWGEIDAAFEADREPWSGSTGELRTLLSRIVNMVPPPYGVGPETAPA
jgi:branched-chain amino acid transport system ATP-binding protein